MKEQKHEAIVKQYQLRIYRNYML